MFYKIKQRFHFGKDFLNLIVHSKNYVSAELFSKGIAILALPIFTRLMSPSEYGVMAVFISYIGIFTIIFGLGIKSAVGRYYYEKENDFFSFFSSNLRFLLLSSVLLIVVCILGANYIQSFFNIPIGMIYIGLPIIVFTAIFEVYKAYLQASRQSSRMARLVVLQAIISISLAILIMVNLSKERYYGRALSLLVSELVLVIIAFISIRKFIKSKIDYRHLKYTLIFSLPLIFHLLSQNILNTFDQIIINQVVGEKETGIYSLAYRIGMIQSIITMGILRAWGPMFYEKMNNNKFYDINNLAKRFAFMVTIVAISLILFSNEILFIFADRSYFEAASIIPVIIIGYFFFFLNTMYARFSFYYKKTKSIAIFTVIAGLVNIGLNYLLIPKYGYGIAAWTTVFSYFLLFVLHYLNVRFFLKSKMVTDIKIFIIPFLLILLVSIVRYYLINLNVSVIISILIRTIILIIMVIFIYLINKKRSVDS